MSVRHVSVLLLYNSKGEILLQHRSDDAKVLPGYWAFFGGGLEDGETPEQALEREITEELNYHVTNPFFIDKVPFQREKDGPLSDKYVYVEKYDETKPLSLGEGQAMGWFLPKDTEKLKMVDHDRPVIMRVAEFLQSL